MSKKKVNQKVANHYFQCPHCMKRIVAVVPAKQKRREMTDWTKVDWNKSDSELARELSKTRQHVNMRRMTHAPEHLKYQHRKSDIRKYWESVDWSKPAEQIAQESGRSIITVLQWRGQFFPKNKTS